MATDDFFRARLDSMIDMRHPLVVLATRMPWAEIEASLAPVLAHKDRSGRVVQDADLFGPTAQLAGAGLSNAGRPRLPPAPDGRAAVPQARLQPQRRRTVRTLERERGLAGLRRDGVLRAAPAV